MSASSTKAIRLLQQLNRPRRRQTALLGALALFLASCSESVDRDGAALQAAVARLEQTLDAADHSAGATGRMVFEAATLAEVEETRLARLQALNDLDDLDPARLSPTNREAFYTYRDRLTPLVELDRYGMAELDGPRPYLMTDTDGTHVRIVSDLTRKPIATRADAEAWLASLSDAVIALHNETQRFLVQTQSGLAPPGEVVSRALADINLQLDASREPAPLRHFRTSLANLPDIPAFEATRLLDEARAIYANDLAPELEELRDVFASSGGRQIAEPGLFARQEGDQRYIALFAYYASDSLDPSALLDFGQGEVDTMLVEIDTLLANIPVAEDAPPPTLAALASQRAAVDEEGAAAPPSEQAVLARLTQRFDWARNNLAQLITQGSVRPLRMQSRAVERHHPLEPVRYEATSAGTDADRLLADAQVFDSWPDWSLPAQAYANGLPGRHLMESRREDAAHNAEGIGAALAEGWSLYAAGLASDLGGYDDRIEDRIGYLQFRALHAALAVVDIGIHQENWNREEAVQYLANATALSAPILDSYIDEITRHPARLTSAYAGSVAIENLRDRADTRLGPRFNLREFHDAILIGGPRPLKTAERDIEEWLNQRDPPAPTE